MNFGMVFELGWQTECLDLALPAACTFRFHGLTALSIVCTNHSSLSLR